MGFIKLVRRGGRPIWINIPRIMSIQVYDDWTVIDIDGANEWLYVNETPEQIMALIDATIHH